MRDFSLAKQSYLWTTISLDDPHELVLEKY